MPPPVAPIIGAVRGIGLATVRLFAEDGWQVAMIDRDAPALAEAVAEVAGAGRSRADRCGGQHCRCCGFRADRRP